MGLQVGTETLKWAGGIQGQRDFSLTSQKTSLKNARPLKKTGILHAVFNMVQGLRCRPSRGCREQTNGNPGHPKKIEATQPRVQMKGHHEQGLCVKWLWQGPNSSGAPNSLMPKSRTSHVSLATSSRCPGTKSDQPHQTAERTQKTVQAPSCHHDGLHFVLVSHSLSGRKREKGRQLHKEFDFKLIEFISKRRYLSYLFLAIFSFSPTIHIPLTNARNEFDN